MAGRIAYYGGIVKDGLILDLDAAKRDSYPGTGTTWLDISGNSYNGTLVNGPIFSSRNLILDGINDYVLLTQSTTNQTIGNYSFSLWFSPSNNITSANTGNYMLMEAQNTLLGGVDNYLYLLGSTAGRIGFQTFNPLSTVYSTTNTWTAENWYNVVGTYDITTSIQAIYINGVLEESTTIANCYFNTNTYFGLGAYSSPSRTWFFPSKLSNFTVYKKTLTSQEVLQNYNATKTRYQ